MRPCRSSLLIRYRARPEPINVAQTWLRVCDAIEVQVISAGVGFEPCWTLRPTGRPTSCAAAPSRAGHP